MIFSTIRIDETKSNYYKIGWSSLGPHFNNWRVNKIKEAPPCCSTRYTLVVWWPAFLSVIWALVLFFFVVEPTAPFIWQCPCGAIHVHSSNADKRKKKKSLLKLQSFQGSKIKDTKVPPLRASPPTLSQYVTLQKCSHIQVLVTNFFPTPSVKLKLGLQ
jgi:hypothetical protein